MTDLLLVEDDALTARAARLALGAEGYSVRVASTGREALDSVRTAPPDVILLDLGLPDIDGAALVTQFRQLCNCPLLILSVRADTPTKVATLDLGADDYVTKPFAAEELAARVRSVLRRVRPQLPSARIPLGVDLEFDPELRCLRDAAGNETGLTAIESMILGMLIAAGSRPLSRQVIHPLLFGREWSTGDRLLDVHVHNLRRKLNAASEGRIGITSVRGFGYALSTGGAPVDPAADGDPD